jgi:hypothetical protein
MKTGSEELGKPTQLCKDNIKMYVKEILCEGGD